MHEYWQDRLPEYINGTLPAEERNALEIHLADCDDCRAAADEWRALAKVARAEVDALKGQLPPLALPGNSRYAPPEFRAPPARKPDDWEDRKMSFSTILRLPSQRQPLGLPVTLVAALAISLLVGTILLFNRTPVSSIIGPQFHEFGLQTYVDEAWNNGNFAVLDDIVSPDFVHYDAGLPEPVTGKEAVIAYIEQFRENLPGVTFTLEPLAEQSPVTGEFIFYTRLTATGDGLSVPLIASAHVVGGRLSEVWFDANALLETQLAERFRREFYRAWTESEWTVDDQRTLWNESVIIHGPYAINPYTDTVNNAWGYERGWAQAFPDLECVKHHVAAESATIIVNTTCEGTFTNKIDLPGFEGLTPSGKRVTWHQATVLSLKNGKIAEFWQYEDNPFWWVVGGK